MKFNVANRSLKVYKNRKVMINVEAPEIDSMLTLESTFNFGVPSKETILELFLEKLEKKAGTLQIDKIQIDTEDEIFKPYKIEEFKNACNKRLKKLQIVIVNKPIKINANEEKDRLLKTYHDDPIFGGHVGQKRLYCKLKSNYYWENMYRDVSKFVKNCEKCKINKPKTKNIEPLQITNTPQKSFDIVVVDTIGPFKKTINGNQYAVTLICDLSKYLILIPIPNKESETVAKAIFEHCILIYGPMRTILSDRGTEYVNQISNELFKLLNIDHSTSTAYHHQTLGSVERNHRVLNEYLRAYINENYDNWDEYSKYFTYCYNTTPHTSFQFKYTPFELVYAKNPTIPTFLLNNKVDPLYNFDSYAIEVKYHLQNMHRLAQQFLEIAKNKNKVYYDKNLNTNVFNINDRVLVRKENRNKLDPLYTGPLIIKKLDKTNALLYDELKHNEKLVHKNRLVKYNK